MKKYKNLQNNVNETVKNMRDEEFLADLKDSNPKEKKWTKKSSIFAFASSFAAIALMLIIGISIWLPKDPADQKHYLKDNETYKYTTVAEVNSQTSFIDIIEVDYFRTHKFYDKVYGDALYYFLSGTNEDTFDMFNINVVVNETYNYNEIPYNYKKQHEILNFTMDYLETCEDYEELYLFKAKGKIITEKEIIYIDYEGISFDGQNPFLSALENLLILNQST